MPLLRAALDEIASSRPHPHHSSRHPSQSVGARHAVPPSSINVILESNTLLQFLKPDLFLMVLHPGKSDFKDSSKLQLDHASAFVLREPLPASTAAEKTRPNRGAMFPHQLLNGKPQFLQRETDPSLRASWKSSDILRVTKPRSQASNVNLAASKWLTEGRETGDNLVVLV